MKRKLVCILLLITTSLVSSCSSMNMKTDVDPFPPTASCDLSPPNQRFNCISGLLKRSEAILNDPGKIVSVKKIESDTSCSRVSVTTEYGASLPEDLRMKRTQTYSICSGSVLERLEDNIILSALSFSVGFITGFFVGHSQ